MVGRSSVCSAEVPETTDSSLQQSESSSDLFCLYQGDHHSVPPNMDHSSFHQLYPAHSSSQSSSDSTQFEDTALSQLNSNEFEQTADSSPVGASYKAQQKVLSGIAQCMQPDNSMCSLEPYIRTSSDIFSEAQVSSVLDSDMMWEDAEEMASLVPLAGVEDTEELFHSCPECGDCSSSDCVHQEYDPELPCFFQPATTQLSVDCLMPDLELHPSGWDNYEVGLTPGGSMYMTPAWIPSIVS